MMAVAKRTKASEKQRICKKLVTLLKKRYSAKASKDDRPILQTILYGICLEDATIAQADHSYDRLHSDFDSPSAFTSAIPTYVVSECSKARNKTGVSRGPDVLRIFASSSKK